ncbi:MAG: hypothetical protein ACXAD7_13015 [Candidatus Kariarchaeaceae archaeon]
MGFKKILSRKSPEDKLTENILVLELGEQAINLFDQYSKEKQSLVQKVITELQNQMKVDGRFIGKKGWYLPKADEKIGEIWKRLAKGPVSLSEVSAKWGLNNKRVYLAMTEYSNNKVNLIRKKDVIYSYPFLNQVWTDSLALFDFDEPVKFESVIDNAKIDREGKNVLEEYMNKEFEKASSELVLGRDHNLRKRGDLQLVIAEEIPRRFEEGITEIQFSTLAEDYGISIPEITKILQELIDAKEVDNITLYPLDELIKRRM